MPRRPGRTGRPPAIADPATVTRMLEAVEAGVPTVHACHYAGIHPATHHRAIAAAEAADAALDAGQPLTEAQAAYRDYRDRFLRARASVAVVHVALVGKAARGGQVIREVERTEADGSVTREVERARPEWKASAWLLSKSFPGELGDRRAVEVTGADGGPIQHASGAEDALRTIADRLAEVADRQRQELPGGWDPNRPAIDAGPAARVEDRGPGDDGTVLAELVEDDR